MLPVKVADHHDTGVVRLCHARPALLNLVAFID